MNCNVPTDICFSFQGFRKRGGLTDEHKDGWGIAFFEGNGCRIFIDHQSSIASPIADLVNHYPIKSTNVIAHIRKATQGEINLENCHPFMRELWGRYWIFAHNGDLKNLPACEGCYYRPVGTTDSEQAFCWILEQLRKRYETQPSLSELYRIMRELTDQLAAYGIFNYTLSNGEFLFAHCSTKLSYIVRKAPFACAHLLDEDVTIDFSSVTTPNDRVAVIATVPLTDNETWTTLVPGQLLLFHDGEPMALS